MDVMVSPVTDAGALSGLFTAYRAHYGHSGSRAETERWLREQLDADRLRVAVAEVRGRAAGFVSTAIVPASLTLRTVWLVGDLYVDPAYRRCGVARALLRHVVEAARAGGAHRLSLRT